MTFPFDISFVRAGRGGAPTNAPTTVQCVLSKPARVSVAVPASSYSFTNANPGTPVSCSTGMNIGPTGFTNN